MIDALQSSAPLIVYVDIKSPYAFVAIQPILELEQSLDVQFDWRPLTLDIPSYLGSARKKAGKVVESNRSPRQWNMIKYAYRDARRYAERQGYMLKGTEKIWDSSLANIAILWVCQTNRPALGNYFAKVYPAFWRRELDIEDVEIVESTLSHAGVETNGFREFQKADGKVQHDQLQSQLHQQGIYGVPSFVIEDKVLFGREHLPLIRWMLGGRSGAAPDIAYEL